MHPTLTSSLLPTTTATTTTTTTLKKKKRKKKDDDDDFDDDFDDEVYLVVGIRCRLIPGSRAGHPPCPLINISSPHIHHSRIRTVTSHLL